MASVVRSDMSPRSISANAPISVRKNRPMVVEVSTASPLRSTMCKVNPRIIEFVNRGENVGSESEHSVQFHRDNVRVLSCG